MRNRQSHRLNGYDYSHNGIYFITIVCQDRVERFGDIINGEIILNDAGKMVREVWNDIPNRFPSAELDSFVIMPNHFHGIIVINAVGAWPRVRPEINNNDQNLQNNNELSFNSIDYQIINDGDELNARADTRPAPTDGCGGIQRKTIGDIICAFKSITTNRYSNGVKLKLVPPFRKRVWQRDYYDIIIKNENMYNEIREYVIHNPKSWGDDRFGAIDDGVREERAVYGNDWRNVC